MTSSIALMISTKPRNGEIITNASGSSSVDLVLWACTSSTTNGTITTNRTGGTMSKKSLTFYHYEDHPYQFNHTDALFQRLHPIKLVHVTVDGTSGGGNSFSGNKKKSKTDSANLVNPTVKRLLSFLKEKCSNNTVDTNDDNMLAQPATLEKVVFENDSIMSSSVDFPRLSTIVQQLLGIDSSSTSDMIDSNIGCKNDDDANVNDRKRAAFLQFTGNTYMQQHPIVARCLQFYFHIVENSWPNCTDDNLLGSYEAVGIHGHLSSHLILDSTAADAIHLWPPSNMGQWTVTGGTKSNNSIAGIVTSNACTSSGKRLLTQWLRQPLIDLVELQLRQDAVHELVQRSVGRDSIRDAGLKLFGSPSHDLIRLASNLKKYETLDVAQEVDSNIEGIEESNAKTNQLSSTGNVRKALLSLYHLYLVSREKIPRLVEQLEMALLDDRNCCSSNILMKDCYEQLKICCTELTKSIDLCEAVLDMEAAPQDFFVRRDYKDELVDICTELDQFQSDLEACHADMNEQWANVSGTSSMNQVRLETTSNETYGDELKYQFRLPNTNDSKTLESSFGSKIRVHRILKNGVYFSTSELRKLSSQKVQLIAEYDRHQTEIVSQAMSVAATYVDVLHRADAAIGLLDAISALAHLASYSPHGYCRPILTDTSDDDSGSIELVQARHPCVELQENIEFIPNDIKLVFGQSSFLLVTGPNSKWITRKSSDTTITNLTNSNFFIYLEPTNFSGREIDLHSCIGSYRCSCSNWLICPLQIREDKYLPVSFFHPICLKKPA